MFGVANSAGLLHQIMCILAYVPFKQSIHKHPPIGEREQEWYAFLFSGEDPILVQYPKVATSLSLSLPVLAVVHSGVRGIGEQKPRANRV
jgi:hypothetical protein